ncbi:hypothetical protein PRCB_01465 [Pantoea rodasii]|uniref:Uncharacterized protein n=1 Tax=Pantoea rodasii TaxID=1076549 RepID=A0A2M9WIH6_9GAMM|nr:hypothetical protein [Pantoea rodasii]ORM64229.1 hypothetical protein HA45_10360 [Pantoea rodasii]PJZ07360.1 hypothetical protein PRCB_01465 [Pantoea rodasii]
MSSLASWSYTAQATVWRTLGLNEYGDSLGWSEPLVIACDYQGGLSKRLGAIGVEKVVKNTIWTEYALATPGDYILIGASAEPDPMVAGADEIIQSIQYADTFERTADDWAIITGV